MTFKEVLADPEGRSLIDAIEDVLVSMQGRRCDPALSPMLHKMIAELEVKTGYRYQLD